MGKKEGLFENSPFAELRATDGSARIRVYTYRYEFSEADNKDDADWQMNYILLSINGVSAEVDAPIIEGRLLEFLLKETIRFRELDISEVDFSFTESEFSFTLSNETLSDSNIIVSGEMISNKLDRSLANVQFEFRTDLKLIDNFISGIKVILKEFPSRYKQYTS